MNQPDQANISTGRDGLTLDAMPDNNKDQIEAAPQREWFPEDEDEWYEPDYCRTDRKPS